MLRIIAIVFFFLAPCCLVGCAPNQEEDTADDRQQQPSASDESLELIVYHTACDAGPEPAQITVTPLAGMTPVVNLDPFHASHLSLGRFFLRNLGDASVFLQTVTIPFGELCAFLDIVALADESGVVSDGDCRDEFEFTLDTILPAQTGMTITIWADTKLGFEASMAAISAKESNPYPGIMITKIVVTRAEIEPPEESRANPIYIRDFAADRTGPCVDFNDDTDAPLLGLELIHDDYAEVKITHAGLLAIPLRLMTYNLSDQATGIQVNLDIEEQDVVAFAPTLVSPIDGFIANAAIQNDKLSFFIPRERVTNGAHLLLFVHVAGENGAIRFSLPEQGVIPVGDPASLIGCYPASSDPYLVP